MDKKTEEIKDQIFRMFPSLVHDEKFEITSRQTCDYNCIAWACQYDDRWMQPTSFPPPPFDCIVYWPLGVSQSRDVQCLIEVFTSNGYEMCGLDWEHEEGFQKVALYVKEGTNQWTHAARERKNGLWTSKLGQSHDIQHGGPHTITGKIYGVVFCIMKKKLI